MSLRFPIHKHILSLAALLVSSMLGASHLSAQSITLEGKAGEYTEERPDYLHIKTVVLTRTSKTGYDVDITLAAPLPNNIKEDVVRFYIGFDIDDNANTGSVGPNNQQFGQDIGASIVKKLGTSRFEARDGKSVVKNQQEVLRISSFKMSKDKISFSLRSHLFGDYDTFKFFVCSVAEMEKNGATVSDIQVSTVSSGSAVTFGSVK